MAWLATREAQTTLATLNWTIMLHMTNLATAETTVVSFVADNHSDVLIGKPLTLSAGKFDLSTPVILCVPWPPLLLWKLTVNQLSGINSRAQVNAAS